MYERAVKLANPSGLHARPARVFAEAAAKLDVPVTVAKGDVEIEAGSVLSLLTLDARHGDTITLRAEGDGAEVAVDELASLVEAGLGESDETAGESE
ncbi:MAG: HPr family phosphocarrier protein [Nitriliruptoraceae bacterium]